MFPLSLADTATSTDHNQLSLILDVLGTPTIEEFYAVNNKRSRDYLRTLPLRKRTPLAKLYPEASAEAIDLMERSVTELKLDSILVN